MTRRRLLLSASISLAWLALVAFPAESACHSFTIAVSPGTVVEGNATTVTVTRDGSLLPSQVEVVSVNETAKNAQDYETVTRTISFTSDIDQSFAVPTVEDARHESTETFRLHLQNGGGCTTAEPYVYGSDARVTIKDDDPASSSSSTPSTSPTPPPTQQASPTPQPTTSTVITVPAIPTPEQTPSDTPTLPEPTSSELAAGPGDGALSGGKLPITIVGTVLLLVSASLVVALGRARPKL